MTDDRAVIGSRQVVSAYYFQRPGVAPSTVLRELEAQQIAELARLAHLDGRRFDGWPKVVLEQEKQAFPGASGLWLLRSEVGAVR